MDSAILMVNRKSKAVAGKGKTIIANIISMTAGVTRPVKKLPRLVG
jgi:hypothetical protein